MQPQRRKFSITIDSRMPVERGRFRTEPHSLDRPNNNRNPDAFMLPTINKLNKSHQHKTSPNEQGEMGG